MSDIGKPGTPKREAFEAAERRANARRYWDAKLRAAASTTITIPKPPPVE